MMQPAQPYSVMAWEHWDELPQPSVAVQVLVWVISPGPGPGVTSVEATTKSGEPSQLSETPGSVNTMGELHVTRWLPAQTRTGAALSTTVMV
jgi:hypothetical protein